MGHADLVHVRKTHGEAHLHPGLVLHHRIYLVADITGRLLYLHQNIV